MFSFKIFKFDSMIKQLLLSFCILMTSIGFSQEEDSYVYGDTAPTTVNTEENTGGFNLKRATIGGGLGLTFGDITAIEIAPNFGYYLTDQILAGIGLNYTYYSDKVRNFSTSIYGGRVYGEYLFEEMPLLIHAEVELINREWTTVERKNIINLYIGGGLKQSLGGYSYAYVLGLWNLNETKESIVIRQPNPVIRIGIAIGF
jgi:hypothetical protein